jgi:hypothetical protein
MDRGRDAVKPIPRYTGKSALRLRPWGKVLNPLLSAEHVGDVDAAFLAHFLRGAWRNDQSAGSRDERRRT